jgi:hypothetical protein
MSLSDGDKNGAELFVIQNESNNRQNKCRSTPTRRYNAHKHTMIMRNVSTPKIPYEIDVQKFPNMTPNIGDCFRVVLAISMPGRNSQSASLHSAFGQ